MNIKQFSLGPLGTNCYLIYQERHAIIIDPGGDSHVLVDYFTKNQLNPEAILLTHGHFDHIGAVEELRQYYQFPVYMHEEEKTWLDNPELNGSKLFIGNEITTKEPDFLLKPGKTKISQFDFDVFHTPGHSPGSISFYFENSKFIVSGDVLFYQGIGRTDLPGGDYGRIEETIRNIFYRLPDETVVYSGHGPHTTIEEEKRNNPFISQK
ncbi:MBL fold metallo-hydrolase [Ornithinibacillus xuwenensis]|uniref:MBL fold metallo-hydrolase n=1 Tax=Ornithinibacillus xuwenensis TaxID=3144668 RepID=A0ABU9XCK9_9BACI